MILLSLTGAIVALSEGPVRGAAAVTFLGLVIPAWRSDVAAWSTVLSLVTALALGVIWYLGGSTIRAWALVLGAAIITIPLLAEALTDAVEARGEPPTPLHRLGRAIAIALSHRNHIGTNDDFGGGDC